MKRFNLEMGGMMIRDTYRAARKGTIAADCMPAGQHNGTIEKAPANWAGQMGRGGRDEGRGGSTGKNPRHVPVRRNRSMHGPIARNKRSS